MKVKFVKTPQTSDYPADFQDPVLGSSTVLTPAGATIAIPGRGRKHLRHHISLQSAGALVPGSSSPAHHLQAPTLLLKCKEGEIQESIRTSDLPPTCLGPNPKPGKIQEYGSDIDLPLSCQGTFLCPDIYALPYKYCHGCSSGRMIEEAEILESGLDM
ncbi:hypothetical protein H920_19015 [Fukomys damarensis]|uniref:Uncharacterized protein n=1 Tax=Fukomys damarensis TaxID=885580 RepID=A0A091CNK8_FUKDA|nr:hypothetical protein H920_19015 [Fukomys damarensis]